MTSRGVFAAAFGVLMTASVVAAPQTAAAAACRYVVQDLPVPAGTIYARTTGSSTNNSRIVGTFGLEENERGVLWVDGALQVMTPPDSSMTTVVPWAVNNTGVVAGRHEISLGSEGTRYRAFRYENGAYEFLQTEPGEQSSAWGINDAGDVVGQVWTESDPNAPHGRDVAARRGSQVLRRGHGRRRQRPAEDRHDDHLVGVGSSTPTRAPRPSCPVGVSRSSSTTTGFCSYERVRVGVYRIAEWDLNGVRVGAYASGREPLGKDVSGTMFGGFGPTDVPSLWRQGGRTDVVADRLPDTDFYGDITDDATLIGSYRIDNTAYPARWLWVCS